MRRLMGFMLPLMLALVDPLYAVFKRAMQVTSATMPVLPRLLKNAQHAFQKRGYGKVLAGGRGFAIRAAVMAAIVMLLVLPTYVGAAMLLAFPAVATTRDLPTILAELKKIQDEHRGKRMPEDVGKKFSELAEEAKALQDEADRETLIANMEAKGKEIVHPTGLPTATSQVEEKDQRPNDIAGFVSLGDFVLASPEFKALADRRFPKNGSASISVKGALNGRYMIAGPQGQPLVALSREERKAFEDMQRESKAVPTLGTGVIEPARLDRFPQVTADDRLTIRDVMSTAQTGQTGSVQYLREESHTQTAAETAHGVEKPEEAVEYSLQSADIATIAAWMPVHTQQLEDFAQLRGLLEGRLRYSVRRREEHQILWGNGSGANLEGIFQVSGTTDIENNGRAAGGDTLIDSVRRGITDVYVAGYNPNAAVIHPYDWETIVLEKGTDDRYVWAVVTDQNGSRIWGLRVVESVAAQKRAGYANEERRVLVGDFQMGAQLLDRMDLTVLIGLIDRQLVENSRTILVEERVALPIYAPAAFAWFRTQDQGT